MASPLATVFSLIDQMKRNLSPQGMKSTIDQTVFDLAQLQKQMEIGAGKGPDAAAANKAVTEKMLNAVLNFAPAGIIVPAMAAGAKMKDVSAAKQLINSGKADEAYKQFRIYQDPTTDQLLKVIPDTNAKLQKDLLEMYSYPGFRGPDLPSSVRFPTTMGSNKVPLADVMSHPELYKASPETAGVQVGKSVGKGFGVHYPESGNAAYLSPDVTPQGEIAIGQTLRNISVSEDPLKQFLSNLLHETQHDVQYRYGLPRGGNVNQFFADRNRLTEAKRALEQVDKTKSATGWAEKVLKDAESKAFDQYQLIPGEVQARLVQKQFESGDYATHPYELMRAMGIDPAALRPGFMAGPLVDLNPTVQNILDVYAPKGAKP